VRLFRHLSSKESLTKLVVSDEGLTEEKAQKRLKLYGDHVLKFKKSSAALKLFFMCCLWK
jgi:hypothetical protein